MVKLSTMLIISYKIQFVNNLRQKIQILKYLHLKIVVYNKYQDQSKDFFGITVVLFVISLEHQQCKYRDNQGFNSMFAERGAAFGE